MSEQVSHLGIEAVETLFRDLGQQHADIHWSDDSVFKQPFAQEIARRLHEIHQYLQASGTASTPHDLASGWFLDNYHVLAEAAAVSSKSLVSDLYNHLPDLSDGPLETPRIFILSCALINACELQVSEQVLHRSLLTYQEHAVLTVAEIWALPIMLRLILLNAGIVSMEKLLPGRPTPNTGILPRCQGFDFDEDVLISRVVKALRLLAAIDWNDFFDSVSRLETALQGDPAGVYAQMDFRTRDQYRKVIEDIAWRTGNNEIEVAQQVLNTANAAPASDTRRRHIGYYLIDQGRVEIEHTLGFLPRRPERIRRLIRRHATIWYLSSIAMAILAFMALPLWLLAQEGSSLKTGGLLALLAIAPAWSLGTAVIQWLVMRVFPPQLLPRMDYSRGIAPESSTIVAIPAMLENAAVTKQLVHDLEVRYLSNPDSQLSFVLLTDFTDAPDQEMPQDEMLLELAKNRINALNIRYAEPDQDIFYLLHRERQWSEGESTWKGWERKRGKILNFNRWILGEDENAFRWHEGNTLALQGKRFVITLDADTMLPKGAAQALAGIMAHPLNKAEFDQQSGRVVAGYTVIQPRVEIDPTSEESSKFTRIVAGDIGIDPYAHAVSDAYQDLFGNGIYVGKGIYDVSSFSTSLVRTLPPHRILSHDLLEGVLGRAGLATDISVYEHYPSHYIAYVRRMHRWVRGDWQLIPWLLPFIPVTGGKRLKNPLTLIDRWKIFENLRRSLFSPLLFLFLVASWLLAPSALIVWTLLGVFAPAAHLIVGIASGVVGGFRRSKRRRLWTLMGSLSRTDIERWALSLSFVCHLTIVTLDAIARTLTRMFVSHHSLLEWVTFSSASALAPGNSLRQSIWREMWKSSLMALFFLVLIAILRPAALPYAAPLLVLWIAAPELTRWLSLPPKNVAPRMLSQADQAQLRGLAFRTWHFFENFVVPDSHWLPPDHFQESPRGEAVHRTSPTNIAMMFLATLVAEGLGFIGVSNLVNRLSYTLDTLTRMPRYRGHILNWVDTSTLEPLEPRYVSTVDSGNLAGALITLRQGCLHVAGQTCLSNVRWQGFCDLLGLLEDALAKLHEHAGADVAGSVAAIHRMRSAVTDREVSNLGYCVLIMQLREDTLSSLESSLLRTVQQANGADLADLEEIETWSNALYEHLEYMYLETQNCFPWLFLLLAPPDAGASLQTPAMKDAWQALLKVAQAPLQLADTGNISARLRVALSVWQDQWAEDQPPQFKTWAQAFSTALDKGDVACSSVREGLHKIADACTRELEGMDFSLLYDTQRSLFHIGYNVSENRLDSNHYDLIASEARLASFIAIARRAAPASHWSQMSRPTVRRDGKLVLLSWTGTMFEYLMPSLLMHSNRQTLLNRACAAAVQQQIAYARKLGIPWGVSESGYYRFDPDLNYQYQAFGVPGLGLKRGLETDTVIAPYASLLAVCIQPQAAMDNFHRLQGLGAVGRFGLFEALDFTPARMSAGQRFQIVRSYMAHHQGMILCALGNYLHSPSLVENFHADSLVRSIDYLLNERLPRTATTVDIPSGPVQRPQPARPSLPELQPWVPASNAGVPQLNVLSNGRLSTCITDHGGGSLQWSDLALTRWRPDSTRDHWGYWIYLRDEQSHRSWSGTADQGSDSNDEHRVVFSPHKVEFSRRMGDLFVRTEICVGAADDVDIRRLEIQNESNRTRHITVSSYAEIVLADPGADEAHPAFEKLFTAASYDTDNDMLVFRRRRRSPTQTPVVLAHRGFSDSSTGSHPHHATERGQFLGRGGYASRPAALAGSQLTESLGNNLDPIFCVQVSIRVKPYANAVVNFVTGVAPSRKQLRQTMSRYRSDASCQEAFNLAMYEKRRKLADIGMAPAMLGDVQRLLSKLHYPDNTLRSHRNKARAQQPALWPFGISGDYPILLLRLHDTEDVDLLETLLRAHQYWRDHGQHVDLVIFNHEATTYGSGAGERINSIINRCHGQDWLSRHGGIFVISLDQIGATDGARLEASALAILDSRRGTLAQQLQRRDHALHQLPHLVPTLSPVDTPAESNQIEGLQYENDFGGFSPDGREYVIYINDGQRPPAPWSNVLANPHFGCLTTESGGGYTWFLNAGEYRLTPWSNDPVSDPAGEALYLRDEQTVRIWSPLPLPGQDGNYRVHHGAGYTRYVHHCNQLEQETRVSVPPDEPVKIVQLRIRNRAAYHRRITATYYAEWVLGARRSQTQPHIRTEYDPALPAIFADCAWNPEFGDCAAFLASSHVTHSFTCDRKEFLGRYGSPAAPEALERVGLARRSGVGVDACAALQIHLELEPQEEITCHFVLGAAPTRETASQLCRKYAQSAAAEEAWRRVQDYWDGLLGTITVNTPEPAMDLLLNRWLLYQTLAARIFARTGFYQSSGAFGFRDQLQDVMALLQVKPELAREQILESARRQFDSGDVLHWWHPPSGKGVRTHCSDDLLWLPFVTGEYVDVTGDTQILDEEIPFLSAPPLAAGEEDRYGVFEAGSESATLLEHCHRALEKGLTSGPNGLPLIGGGDWNDGMNRVGIEGRGESVWLAWFACAAARHFLELCKTSGTNIRQDRIEQWIQAVQETVQQKAWDGAWYRRAFYDDGAAVGSAADAECRIDSISQSWATLSHSPAGERAGQALEEAIDQLVDEEHRIIALLTPPFDIEGHDPGYIKAYPPGVRENGGQYTHAAVWLAWALAQRGDGDRAAGLFRLLNPVLRGTDRAAVERYRVEPYVLAADIYTSPQYLGRGGWTWYTGSAAWLWRFGVERLLGLCRQGGELVFDPCIPSEWPGFAAQIRTDGATIQVKVRNPEGKCRGVQALELGGRMIASNRVAIKDAAGQDIIVHMG